MSEIIFFTDNGFVRQKYASCPRGPDLNAESYIFDWQLYRHFPGDIGKFCVETKENYVLIKRLSEADHWTAIFTTYISADGILTRPPISAIRREIVRVLREKMGFWRQVCREFVDVFVEFAE